MRRTAITAGLLGGMLAGLATALPVDHVTWMQRAVAAARAAGLDNVDWTTFVAPLHPHRDPTRRRLLRPHVPVRLD